MGESYFSTFYTLVLLFPSGSLWKRKTWRLAATWKSISQDAKITGSVVFEYHTIRYLLWVEQPRIVLWKLLIHTVYGPHPRELNEKENAYQCISRAFLGMLRFQEVCEREKRCFENLIRITYLIQEQTKKMEDAAWNQRSIRHSFGDREKVWRREDNKGNSSRINAVAFFTVSIFFQSIWAFITSHPTNVPIH